ncbi:TatD DNase family protein [Dyadobacter sp. SG02]|uniref:TatD family hydrolase n=1 Tax=Dyadobacter sp. SG02 TaxID=1855291 RepID=UPI0008AB7A62|nr:TatD family hydrolase [Dyadobacter sp. SG02]SEJ03699.1 TatD DNase family protein [Dyadobacter sp. SG02]
MFLDVHTHVPVGDVSPGEPSPGNPSILAIENRHSHFGESTGSRYVSAGLHPWYIRPETLADDFEKLSRYAVQPQVIAIGECGLDKLTATDWDTQCRAFEWQIALAEELRKPLVIHCVKAFQECLAFLRETSVPVIFHGVNNRLSLIRPVIEAGYFLSFGKTLLHPNAAILDTFRAVPLEQLFLETDDSPTDIREIYKTAARLRNIPEKEIVLQLESNFGKVFKQ